MKHKKSYHLNTVSKNIDVMDVKDTAVHITNTTERIEMQNINSDSKFPEMLKFDKSTKEMIHIGIGEIIGTAILMFLGCLGCIGKSGTPPPSWQGSLTFGFAVFMAVQSTGHISGAHINPCVTLGTVILEMTSLPLAAVYIVCQFIGAIVGFGLIQVVLPTHHIHSGNPNKTEDFCVTLVSEDISIFQGLIFEILATGLLLIMLCAMWDKRNAANTDSSSLKPGLAVFVLCIAIAPYTGCSMNPARSLAPAIFNNRWADHWIYWVGPIIGTLISCVFYKYIYWPKDNDILIEN